MALYLGVSETVEMDPGERAGALTAFSLRQFKARDM